MAKSDSKASSSVMSGYSKERIAQAVSDFMDRARNDDASYARLAEKRDRETRPKRQRRTSPYPLEKWEQAQVVEWCQKNGVRVKASLEGAYLGPGGALRWKMLAKQGASSGNPDLEITTPVPGRPEVRGVAIEMKSTDPRARRVTEHVRKQMKRLAELREDGWETLMAFGHVEAIEWLKSLGYGQREAA